MTTNISSYGVDSGARRASQMDSFTGRTINGHRRDTFDSQNAHINALNVFDTMNAVHSRPSSSGSNNLPPNQILVPGGPLGAALANAGNVLGSVGQAGSHYTHGNAYSSTNLTNSNLGHRPDLKLNLSNQQGSLTNTLTAAISDMLQTGGHGLGLEIPRSNAQLSENFEGGSNRQTFVPGSLSPLSAVTSLHPMSQPHSPSAEQVPPASPFQISPHSPFAVSPDGVHSAGGLSPLFQHSTQSPVSLSPHFGASHSSREPSPIRPSSANPPTRHGKQWTVDGAPLSGDLSRSPIGKMRGRSAVPRTNTAGAATNWDYAIQDPNISPRAAGPYSGHGRFASGTQIPRSPNLHARNPSASQTKRNDAVDGRFQRGRGHSVGSMPENNSVMARAGSNVPRTGGSRGTSPYIVPSNLPGHQANGSLSVPSTELGIPGGLALTVENLALSNAAYPNNMLQFNVQNAPSQVGSISDLGDIYGPSGSALAANEFKLDASHSSQLLAPPLLSPHTPQSGALGSPHLSPISPHLLSPQFDLPFPFDAPSPGNQFPPPSPIEPLSGASSPYHGVSPLASPLYRPTADLPMPINGATTMEIPSFDDLGGGLFMGTPPFSGSGSTGIGSLPQSAGPTEQQWKSLGAATAQPQVNHLKRMEEETRMQIDNYFNVPSSSDQITPSTESFDAALFAGLGVEVGQQGYTGGQSQDADLLSGFNFIPSPQRTNEVLPSPLGMHTPEPLMHPELFPANDSNIHASAIYGSKIAGYISASTPVSPVGFDSQWSSHSMLTPEALQALQQQSSFASSQEMQSTPSNTLEVPKAKRPNPMRRRSRSALETPFHNNQNNAHAQLAALFPPVSMSARAEAAQLASHPDSVDEDVVLGGPGPSRVRTRHSASAAVSNTHKRAHSSFEPPPTINVTNWDSERAPLTSYGQRPAIPHSFSMTPSGQSYQATIIQPAQTLLNYNQQPPLPHSASYPPPNPVPTLPGTDTGASIQRVSSLKARQQGQRHELNSKLLDKAFTEQGFHRDPALRRLFDLILSTQFYQDETLEPMLGTPEAEVILAQVRVLAPNDPRFAPKDPLAETTPAESADRDTQSIYMLFTENNECLICGKKTDRSGRALGHVRSDINHRPYHCTCDKCRTGNNPRKFFSDNLLDDHLKGQTHKQQCQICHNFFRRGGMKRHMNSKHPNVEYHQAAEDEE